MVYFCIDVHFDTIEGNGFRKPQISVYDTTFSGAVNQIRDIVSNNACSQISFAYVWYIGRTDATNNEILSSNYYNGKNFISMINNTLGEGLL